MKFVLTVKEFSVKYSELSSKNRAGPQWLKFAAASLLAIAIAGCGGGGGSDGAPGAAGAPGAPGATGANGANAVPTVKATTLTSEQWRALSLQGEVTKVTINSPPVVDFKVTDASGAPVVGLAQKNAAGAYPNFAFAIAKLIPAAASTNSPSRWVSYFVLTTPAAGKTAVPGFPEAESDGILKDNLDGSYTYTFALDITKAKSYADAAVYDAAHVKADLDDLTYDPALPHRLMISVGGKQPGTTSTAKSSANISYDFIPATGKAVSVTDPQRTIVDMASCNACHSQLAMHANFFPAIQDPKLCVVCHTEQQKYGSADANPASGNTLVPAGTYAAYGATLKLSGRALPNFPNMVHHIHMGKNLYYQGYNQFGVKYNEVTYPQPITNCVKCHDGSETATNKTTQGDNWKNVPSLLACGSCHDGINFATGAGTTAAGAATGHVGGAKADDKLCALCHDAASISTYHVTVDPTGSNGRGGYPLSTVATATAEFPVGFGPTIPVASQLGNLPAGVFRINFEIKSVTVAAVTGGKQATVVYRTLKDGSKVTFNSTGNLIDNVDGNPGIYLAYGTPVDGVTVPVDWNGPTLSVAKFKELRSGTGGTQTGPDADGYYTAVLSYVIPSTAKMITAAVGIEYNGFVQLGLAAYPKGIRLREPAFAIKTATGETPRRAIVSNAKCNSCHGQLGVGPSFHSGARNNGEGCAICHQPITSTGHVGVKYSFGGGWNVGVKNLVHSIHASGMRGQAFSYEATAANPGGFQEVTYPGVLNKCEQCHVAGSYDFSAAANAAALPNLLWTTDAKGNMLNDATTNPTSIASIGLSPWVTSLGKGQIDYTADNLVTSPVTSSCFGCHDSKAAVAHMQLNGGTVYGSVSAVSVSKTGDRSMGFTKVESCMVCHASGKVADIKAAHMN